MKDKKQYIISFFIPILILVMVYSAANIIFWGTKSFLISDSKAQYISLFSYLREVIKGNESLFYSFSKGMGGNMLGTFAYYLASPLNWLIIFFSKKTLVQGMLLIISLKIGLSGLTMFSYLKSRFKRNNALYIFSTSYSLMGYIVVYFFNIMWLDAIYFAPLLLIGIDKIIDNKKSLMYGIVLSMAILSNYYTGYMLCILSCLYFIYQLLLKCDLKKNKEQVVSSVIKFFISSILSGLITSFLLFPTIYELIINSGRLGVFRSYDRLIDNDPLIIFSRFFIGAHNRDNVLNKITPALYSSLIVLPLVYFYFVNKKIKIKEKVLSGLVIIFFISGFFIEHINFIWHGFSYANSFCFRYTFIISLFLIILACKSFYKIKYIDLKHYLIFLIGYLALSNLVIFKQYVFLNTWFIFLSAGILILYLLIIYFYHHVSDKDKKTLKLLLIVLVFSELLVNFYLSIYKYELDYKNEYKEIVEIVGGKINELSPADDEFYRVEKNLIYSSIDSMLMNYNGISIFLSTLGNKSHQIISNLGNYVSPSTMRYKLDTSPLTDSIFGIKYFIAKEKNLDYKLVDTFTFSRFSGLLFNVVKSEVKVYENPNALSLGYMVSDKVYDFIKIFGTGKINNAFEVQNYILKTMLNSNDSYFKSYDVAQIGNDLFDVKIDNNKKIYIIVPVSIVKDEPELWIYINDSKVHTYDFHETGIFTVENKYENSTIKLKMQANDNLERVYTPSVYYFDDAVFLDAIDELKKNQLDIIEQKKNYIKGKVNVTEDKTVLFTTIPYEKGWTILVDGEKVDYNLVFDAFIGLDLDAGEHQIEFKFIPPLFKVGMIISIISAILFIIYIKFEQKIINFLVNIYNNYEEIINYLIAGGLTTIVSISSYAMFAKLFNINYIVSTVLSFVLAVIFAYFINKIFVFKTNFEDKKMVINEMYQFIKYRILSLGIDVILMILFIEALHINDLIAKIVVQVVIVIANYFFSKLFIFRKKANN